MARPYPNGRRRRPGRRPPHRYAGNGRHPRPGGFTAGALGPLYRALLPGLRGAEKRRLFNGVSRALPLGLGLGGTLLGYAWLGPLGAALGLGAGLAAGASAAEKERFFRR